VLAGLPEGTALSTIVRKVGVGYATVARIAETTKRLQPAGTGLNHDDTGNRGDITVKMLTIHNSHPARKSHFCWGVEGEIPVPTPAVLVCGKPDCGCDRFPRRPQFAPGINHAHGPGG
jgi:hypothetical protein